MSAPKDHYPQVQEDSHKVIAEFIEHQEQLLGLLGQASIVDINQARVPVSIAKWMKLKLGDTFLFLIAHHYRHVLQAGRALEKEGVGGRKPESFVLSEL